MRLYNPETGNSIEVSITTSYTTEYTAKYFSEWFNLSNGAYSTYDMGSNTDSYKCTVNVSDSYEIIQEISNFLYFCESKYLYVYLSEGEEVLGSEFMYDGVTPFYCILTNDPSYTYVSLDYGSMSFTLKMDKSNKAPFKELPSGYTWESIPWEFNASTKLNEARTVLAYYDSTDITIIDDVRDTVITASCIMTRELCTWLKLTLGAIRASSVTIPNTYFKLDSKDTSTLEVKFKSYSEKRESVNLYAVTMELIIL